MANIYQIRSEIENFDFEVDQETGEILNATAWDELQMAFDEKVENIACFIKNLAIDINGFKQEEEQLAKRRKRLEKKVEYLKRLLAENMNEQKFSTARCEISFRRSEAVEIVDENKIPQNMMIQKVSFSPDKVAIKKMLKEGQEVGGCRLIENLNTQIK